MYVTRPLSYLPLENSIEQVNVSSLAKPKRLCVNDPASQRTTGKDRHLREHECLADVADGDAFRCLPQRGLEALDRFAKVFGAEAESLMMDRHDEMSAGFIGHLHGLFRSAVRMNSGIVSADRHDRQIDGTGRAQLRKRIAQRGVARKKEPTVISFENVAVVAAIGIAPRPRAPMFDPERDDVDLAGESCYRFCFFPTQLG